MSDRQARLETHQPSKEKLEEVIEINATPDEIARAVLTGGAARRESVGSAAPGSSDGRP